MCRLEVTRTALREADDIAFHISLDSPRAAARFLNAIDETYAHLKRVPEAGVRIVELAGTRFSGVRSCTITRFRNYIVIYSLMDDEIEILHIVDGRRDYFDLFDNG